MDKDQLKQMSIEGCELIDTGAHASVYRIAPDEIVKVYREDIPFDKVLTEKRRSKRALILGVPTAISFDIVKVGNCFGAVYELLDAEPTNSYVNRSEKNLEDFISMSVKLLKRIHGIDADTSDCADMKADHFKWVDPIFDLATIANSYWIFPQMAAEAATVHLGISVESAYHIWKRTRSLYYDGMSAGELAAIERKARILGLLRIIDFAQRSAVAQHRDLLIQQGVSMLHEAVAGSSV